MPHHAIVSDFQVGDLSIKTRLKRGEEWPINGPGEGQFPRWRRGANIWREVTNPWNGSKLPRNRTVNEKGIAMKRCAQCHGPLGLGVRSRNVWNGRWWDHVRYCSSIARPFMSWSDTTPAPTVADTPSYLAPVRRAEPSATSPEMPLRHLVVHMRSSSSEDHG